MRFPVLTRYRDFDAKGHVNNAVYLTYFEMARQHAWGARGGDNENVPFILAEATVKFVSQARLTDVLDIELTTSEIRSKAWVFRYVVRAADERVVAEGSTVQVMFDYANERTMPIPTEIRFWLEAL